MTHPTEAAKAAEEIRNYLGYGYTASITKDLIPIIQASNEAYAQARIAELETRLEAHAWKVSPAMAQAQIDQLVARNAELERDKARLDWLDRNPMTYERGCGRAAIDAAMTPPPNNLPHA